MKGGGSSSSEMAVYEFDADEMAVEAEATKRTAKFHGCAVDDKYAFLQSNFSSVPDKKQTEEGVCIENRAMHDDVASHFNRLMQFSADHNQHLNSPGNAENDSSPSESEPPSDDDEDEPENNGYFEEQAYDNACYPSAIVKQGEIVLRSDHMTCGTSVYSDAIFTFNSDGIKIEGKDFEDQDFEMECSIDDIFHINCMPNSTGQSASMKIVLRHDGVVKLSIDSDAEEMEYMIKNLSSRYMEIWNSVLFDENISGANRTVSTSFFPQFYFNGISDNFGEVIYPKGDPDAVSIRKSDIDLLLPETFVNDTIIDFYIKYLNNNIGERKRKRLHFFNSFFFRKLADLDKEKNTDGRAAFLKVKKWTRKLNIFDKDFIFIPVNFNLHWSLLVICHPGEITKFGGENIMECEKVPCILHMDSLKGNHDGVMNIIQSYLWEEWKEKNANCTEDYSPQFLNLRFISLDCPQQDNCFDCGLFLLHYVEMFLEDAPLHFNPSKLSNNNSTFLNPDWFPPADASHKRTIIRKLIYDLLNEISITNNEMDLDQEDQEEIEEESGIELLSQQPVLTNRAGTGDDNELESMEITEPVVQQHEIIEQTTCILDDDEEWEARACTSVDAEMDAVYEEAYINCQSQTCQLSNPNSTLVQNDEQDKEKNLLEENEKNLLEENEKNLLEENEKNLLEENEKNLLEDSAEVPSSPRPDISGYVPDTPILSLNDTAKEENIKIGENSIIGESKNIGFVPETPIVSSDDVEKSNLQNAVIPDTPMVDSQSVEAVLETPVESQKEEESEKEKEEKCVLSEEAIVLESPVPSHKEEKVEKCVLSEEAIVLESPVASQKEEKVEKCGLSEEAIVLDSQVPSQKEEKQEKCGLSQEAIVLDSPVASQNEGCEKEKQEKEAIVLDSPVASQNEGCEKEKQEKEAIVLDSPVASQNEGCEKEKQEKEAIVLDSPVASQNEGCEKEKQEKEAIVLDSPVASQNEGCEKEKQEKEAIVLDSPVASQNEGCEKESLQKCTLSEADDDDCMEIEREDNSALETRVEEKKRDDVTVLESAVENKEEFEEFTVEMESSKEASFRVSTEDVIISDDEGSVEQTPRKKRRKEFNLPEGSRRLTRSAVKGSAVN